MGEGGARALVPPPMPATVASAESPEGAGVPTPERVATGSGGVQGFTRVGVGLRELAERCARSSVPSAWRRLREELRALDVPPEQFSASLAMAEAMGEPGRFRCSRLFARTRGLQVMRTPAARRLFELFFIGNGCAPLRFSGSLPTEMALSSRGSDYVQYKGAYPGSTGVRMSRQEAGRVFLEKCSDEVKKHRYTGPYTVDEARSRVRVVSNGFLVVTWKTDGSLGKIRPIHNLSSREFDVNGGIEYDGEVVLDHGSVVAEGVREVLQAPGGRRATCGATEDVVACFRNVALRAADKQLTGIKAIATEDCELPFWDGVRGSTRRLRAGEVVVFRDECLGFGGKSSPHIVVSITSFVRDAAMELVPGAKAFAYIDDFKGCGPGEVVTERIMDTLRSILEDAGMPTSEKKRQSASRVVEYLGLVYDYAKQTISLPEGKRESYLRHLSSILERDEGAWMSGKELASITGKLVHARTVYPSGKVFYQRLLACSSDATKRKLTQVDLSVELLGDFRWWKHLLAATSGAAPICAADWTVTNTHGMYSDASGSGWGCYYNGRYMWGTWSEEILAAMSSRQVSINELELVMLVVMVETWGRALRGERLLFWCDNAPSVHSVTSQSSRTVVRQALLRRLFVGAAVCGVHVRAQWLDTASNPHADSLSRQELTKFFALPHTHPLRQEPAPRLGALELLLDPTGPANPCAPGWVAPTI